MAEGIQKDGTLAIKKSTSDRLVVGFVSALVVSSFFGGYILGSERITGALEHLQLAQVMSGSQPTQSPQPSQPTQSLQPSQPTQSLQPSQPTQSPQLQGNGARLVVSVDDDPVRGSPNARVTIVEFSDFQCPFCERFFQNTEPQIQQQYIDTGKVKFVYRDFPLDSLHPNARSAALASECAYEQGKFWEYHAKLFETQGEWASLAKTAATNKFKEYAANLKLNSEKFDACLDSAKYANEINKDVQDGISYNVDGTPTFYIGNDRDGYTKVVGAQPYGVFQQLIDRELG